MSGGINDLISFITNGLSVSFPDLVLLAAILPSLIFFASDIRIGLLITLLMSSLTYAGMEWFGIESYKALVVIFITVVLLALSFYITHKKGGGQLT